MSPVPEDDHFPIIMVWLPGWYDVEDIVQWSLLPNEDGVCEHYFLVKWKGFGLDDMTWEPHASFASPGAWWFLAKYCEENRLPSPPCPLLKDQQ